MDIMVQRCEYRTGDYIDNKYYVEKNLGEGSFGKVFKVKEGKYSYALKLLKLWEVPPEIRQKLIDRFDMEFQTGRIESKYLVQSFSYGYAEGNPYIVMEFCPNGDLLQLVEKSRPDLFKIGREILYGLKILHRCGKVHRDLKPENVLIKEDGTAALTDFGIAGDRNKRMTEKNIVGKPIQIFGTYAYMPPEQVNPKRGDVTVLPTTDIFSFGVVMYQLLTGILPFGNLNDENDLAIYIRKGREGNWDRKTLKNAKNGTDFQRIIEGCLIPDFKLRLQSADNVLALFPPDSPDSVPQPLEPIDDGFQREIVKGVLLRVMQGEEHGKVYYLNYLLKNGQRIITIGRLDRGVSNIISLLEEQGCYMSRKQCTLEWDQLSKIWYIRDGQWDQYATDHWRPSLNGTFVNSTEVSIYGMPFYPGDIISIGDTKLRAEGY